MGGSPSAAADTAPLPTVAEEEAGADAPLPGSRRRGIGLCLSGGGFRASLFHLGALRRMNELGILSRDDFRTVASVSGGSIAAAQLASALAYLEPRPGQPIPRETWDREVRDPLRAFTRKDVRTGALLRRLLPWNLARSDATVNALAERYQRDLVRLRLAALPIRPEFLFLATDMAYGVSFIFSREWIGDYQVGYMAPPPDFPVATAVAASGCFPPLCGPLRLRLDPAALKGGSAPRDQTREECVSSLRLTDGGDYDNMGLEPVWKTHAVVLVSDAGGLFTHESDRGLFWRIPRYQAIQERQARGVRKRWLIASFNQELLQGAYWSVSGASSDYSGCPVGYSKALARGVLAEIRTDLDAFSDAEAAVLENHGYVVADAALRRHAGAILPDPIPPASAPHPDWMPPARSEEAVRAALAGSARRQAWGRARG
ncbi:MAG TPA: patatin-like phospholipase family protein [Vicinamibacteria bacterium]|nr:patatin-like phospholipase family protein [Vicinamibacteria bacterium]